MIVRDFKSHPAAALPNSLDSKLSNIVAAAFTPVLAKHTKHLSLVDELSIGVADQATQAGMLAGAAHGALRTKKS